MGTPKTSAVSTLASGPGVASYTQMYGEWVKVHDDCSYANTAATLLNPRRYTSDAFPAYVHPIIVTQGSYVRFVGQAPVDVFTYSPPVLRIFGADKVPDATGAFPSGTIFWRLDASTFTATGTSPTAINPATAQTDGAEYYYSEMFTHNGMNLHGAKAILPIVETATDDIYLLYAQIVNI